jgi:hypothetical protein
VRFGSRAKNIKNKPKVNMTRSMREVEGLLEAANKQITRQNKVTPRARVARSLSRDQHTCHASTHRA